ncbi:glycoside hydrolase family 19 protein [Pseudomonas stutzeri]|uniref:Glycoside hydrolase family 19 n=1 Tax=Stutzerimonas stutzeri TaxID=316 RepID=A0A2N8RZ76_STUST|nr:glycoside hydrolase family 19 protein [Stutzerimonas stutzeri]MCQ4297510.1 glycoside hydrolase family 19 protein [Stutzerimonas stutzeri]PNF79646.1 glycoside hydrolase family 19 [Stutzerimonas stutzeri]
MRPLTEQQLLQILPNARPVAGVFVPALNRAMARFRIDSPVRRAAFLAQIGHESGQLRRLVENLNYSAAGLAATWPGRFRAANGQPNALAMSLERQPERIANLVYAGRMGNGSVESGDGWRYRGRGLIQLTGCDNYRACGVAIGADLVAEPVLLEQPEWAAMSAAWFWSRNGLNELADVGRFEDITRRINGGTHGQPQRLALWRVGQEVLA